MVSTFISEFVLIIYLCQLAGMEIKNHKMKMFPSPPSQKNLDRFDNIANILRRRMGGHLCSGGSWVGCGILSIKLTNGFAGV